MEDPLADPEAPRRLTRSTSDKYLAGVAGGLGRYFGVDPVLFRVAFAVSVVFGGIGIVAYIALIAFLRTDDGEPSFMEGRSRTTSLVLMVLLAAACLSFLGRPAFVLGPGLLGLAIVGGLAVLLYRAFGGGGGDDPARAIARGTLVLLVLVAALGAGTGVGIIAALGGGVAVAVIAIAAGVGLIVAGVLGGARWLILPVIVLVLPLAVVSAAGIDLHGGVGHREYRPAQVGDLRPEYRVGMGELELDLRDVTLPPGSTDVKLVVGIGHALVRVPNGACVSADGQIGAGAARLPGMHDHGVDVDLADAAPRGDQPELHVDADLGLGYLEMRGGSCA